MSALKLKQLSRDLSITLDWQNLAKSRSKRLGFRRKELVGQASEHDADLARRINAAADRACPRTMGALAIDLAARPLEQAAVPL